MAGQDNYGQTLAQIATIGHKLAQKIWRQKSLHINKNRFAGPDNETRLFVMYKAII
jgi:hypothetical protein